MVHIIEGVLPALFFLAGFDLCFLGGEYTYWVRQQLPSSFLNSALRTAEPQIVGGTFALAVLTIFANCPLLHV